MNQTVLICPACKGTSFVEKGHEGKILVHCATCQTAARVEKAGIAQVVDNVTDAANAIYPLAKVVKEKKEKSGTEVVEIFEDITFSIPKSVKALIQAALWCGKCHRNVVGKWYAGTVVGDIMADYLAGFDFRTLAPADYQRVEDLLKEAAEAVTDVQMKELNLIQEEERKNFHIAQIQKITDAIVPQLEKIHAEKVIETEKMVSDGKEKQAVALHRGKCLERLSRGITHIESRLKEPDLSEEKLTEYTEHLEVAREFYNSLELNAISPFDADLKTVFETIEIPKRTYIRHKDGSLIDPETGAIEDDNFSTPDEIEILGDSNAQENSLDALEASNGIVEDIIKPAKQPRKKKSKEIPAPVLDDFWQDLLVKGNVVMMKLEQKNKVKQDDKIQKALEKVVFLSEAIKGATITKSKATAMMKDLQTFSGE